MINPPPPPTDDHQAYVLGFMFDDDMLSVVMILKDRPKWQAGKLNGVGGKIEQGELPHSAMVREFKEETGVMVPKWTPIVKLRYRTASLYVYASANTCAYLAATTQESEEIQKWYVKHFATKELSKRIADPNLQWLIPMARYGLRDRRIECTTIVINPL